MDASFFCSDLRSIGADQHSLVLFVARISPDLSSKETRLIQLREACWQGDNALVRVLAGFELVCIQSQKVMQAERDSQQLHGKLMQETMVLIRDIDSIMALLVKTSEVGYSWS